MRHPKRQRPQPIKSLADIPILPTDDFKAAITEALNELLGDQDQAEFSGQQIAARMIKDWGHLPDFASRLATELLNMVDGGGWRVEYGTDGFTVYRIKSLADIPWLYSTSQPSYLELAEQRRIATESQPPQTNVPTPNSNQKNV